MAHYAFLDDNNIVVEIIPGKDENFDNINWEEHYGNVRQLVCKRTSYNSLGGIHYDSETNLPDGKPAYRKNYAGIGYAYDVALDAFIPPKPFPSWILNEQTCLWDAPVPKPNDGSLYYWDETSQSWIKDEN